MVRTSILAWVMIVAVCACQSTPPAPGDGAPSRDEPAAADSPDGLLEEAARASGGRQARLYVEAAEQYLAAGDVDGAEEALNLLDPDALRPRFMSRYLFAWAQVDLARGALERARRSLDGVDPQALPEPAAFDRLSAQLDATTGDPAAAAERLMALAASAPDGRRQQLNDDVWRYMGETRPFNALERARRTEGEVRAWWQLKAAMLRSFTLAEQRRALDAWRQAHPDHPAAGNPPTVLHGLQAREPAVQRVALLLPLSGPLSRAGRAVRDAFIATYLNHRDDVGFEVTVYDTSAEPMGALYERALVNGADVLIGPLAKESVAALNQLNPEIPVLALNYLGDETPAASVLQLGLAIEDEAATLEAWLEEAGADRLLVLHNADDWATRATGSVRSAWTGPLTVQALEDIRTVTESVGVAMHVAASEERHSELERLLGQNLEFLPRARRDVDAILALVTELEATALVPALKFHFASQVPVYATSQTVRGADAAQLRELEGFHVAELPWFTMEPVSYASLDQAFGLQGSPFAALYALGVDAFRLAERVPLIIDGSLGELLGSTGELTFTDSGRIQRRLARTVVRNGKVTAADRSLGR